MEAVTPSYGVHRPGRRGHSLGHYVAVAVRYRALIEEGRHNPTATIAKERNVSRHTAAGWVRRCRSLKLLPPATPGRADRPARPDLHNPCPQAEAHDTIEPRRLGRQGHIHVDIEPADVVSAIVLLDDGWSSPHTGGR